MAPPMGWGSENSEAGGSASPENDTGEGQAAASTKTIASAVRRRGMKVLQSAELVAGPEATEKIQKKYPGPDAADEERGQVAMNPPWHSQENGQAMRAGREHWTEAVTNAYMMQALSFAMKKKRCKSPGRSGMRYEHLTAPLKLNVEDDTEKAILEKYVGGLTAVVRAMLLGCAPAEVMMSLRKGRATCLRKRDNGVRPIVAVEVLVKLAGATAIKCLGSDQQQDAYEQLVGSVQMGAGRRGGAEAVVHAAQQCYEDAATHNRDGRVGGSKHGMLLADASARCGWRRTRRRTRRRRRKNLMHLGTQRVEES